MSVSVSIVEAGSPDEFTAARRLFVAYAKEIAVDLCFQGFQEELETLPGAYARPDGFILLGRMEATEPDGIPQDGNHASDSYLASIAVRPLPSGNGDRVCELKRMYVSPELRGQGVARQLAEKAIAEARQIGYAIMRLDTLRTMTPAITLYESLGFEEVPAYYHNPLAQVKYMSLQMD